MARSKKRGDIDADYTAIRLRMTALTAAAAAPSNVVPPHGHAAANITFDETQSDGSGRMAADDVQEAIEELDSEKLARSGEQPMLGNLDMNHWSINNISNAEVEQDLNMTGGVGSANINGPRDIHMAGANGESDITGVRDISFVGDVGEGVIDQPRVIHMAGDDTDSEARIDGLEAVIFNNEPTKSYIDQVSRIEYNVAVEAGTSYTAEEGRSSWDTLEDILIAYAASGAGVVAIALGWGVGMAVNNYNPV